MIKKQGILNLSSYSCKSYASVVLSDSEIALLREQEDAAFHPFINCVFFLYTALHNQRSMSSSFLVFILQGVFH